MIYSKQITAVHATYTEIWELQKKLKDTQTTLKEDDIRVYFYTQINSVLTNIIFAYMLAESFHSDEWWTINCPDFSKEEKPKQIKCFEQMIKLNLIDFEFNLIEDLFRQLVRHISPGSCNEGKAEFESIYKCLFKSLKMNIQDDKNPFILYRISRNLIHNNGFYFPTKNKLDKDVVYKGDKYSFIYGKKVTYEPSLPILLLLTDIANLFFLMCESKILKEIPYIKHALSNE